MRYVLPWCLALALNPVAAAAEPVLFHFVGHTTDVTPTLSAYASVGTPFEFLLGWDTDAPMGHDAETSVTTSPGLFGLDGSILGPHDLSFRNGATGPGVMHMYFPPLPSTPYMTIEMDGSTTTPPLAVDGLSASADYVRMFIFPTVPLQPLTGPPDDLGVGATGNVHFAYRATIDGFEGNWVGSVLGQIDSIERVHSVPEPTTLLLMGVGSVLMFRRRLK